MDLQDFANRYDALVDLLCRSAQCGITENMRWSYVDHKEWFTRNYAQVKSEVIGALLDKSVEDRSVSEGKLQDFEALFLQQDLDSVLNSESMLPRIDRSRQTLNSLK